MFDSFNALGEVILKAAESCKQFEGIVSENFEKDFRYHRKELESITELLNEWNDSRLLYAKTNKKLKEKKETLHSQKDTSKWELSENCKYPLEVLMKNKKIAFQEMLPKETKDCMCCKDIYGYYSNKVPEELERIFIKDDVEIRKHLADVSKMTSEAFERVKYPCANCTIDELRVD